MPKILGIPQGKIVQCHACNAAIDYMPEDVERHEGRDMYGGPDGYERVKCPRKKCPGHGYIRSW